MVERTETRRRVLQTAGIVTLAGLAGCTGTALPGEGSSPEGVEGLPTTGTPPANDSARQSTESSTPMPPDEPTVTPYGIEEQHVHGTMIMTINGQMFQFGDKPWNVLERTGNEYFHFHTDGKPDTWHVHAMGVTLGYAIGTMPKLEVTESSLTFRGHTYDASSAGTEISVSVNGQTIDDIGGHILQDGDAIELTVETDAETPTPTPTTTPDATTDGS